MIFCRGQVGHLTWWSLLNDQRKYFVPVALSVGPLIRPYFNLITLSTASDNGTYEIWLVSRRQRSCSRQRTKEACSGDGGQRIAAINLVRPNLEGAALRRAAPRLTSTYDVWKLDVWMHVPKSALQQLIECAQLTDDVI
ncbi:unnamed protein product [Soboliphyme baturini]|uniref:Uncharacterized protein n=1 Tax=Soboliphyme baturini TaxID=241478 RepID=A0A183IX12_9BILA|nr:unnamed protein product [Soboliphyme baturini]